MHITKSGCSIKCPTQVFGNESLWVEYELKEGENANDALNAARQLCYENHRAAYPHLYPDQETKVSDIANAVIENKQRPKDSIQGMIFDMRSVTDLTVLKTYEKLALMSKNKEFMEAYQSKFKELTQ